MESYKREISRKIGLKLKELRQQQRWSQTEMAARLGVTCSGYNKNEKGENKPGIVLLQRLWEKFDISMDWLFFDEGPRTRTEKKKRETLLEQELEALKRELAAQRGTDERQEKEWQEKAAALELKPEVEELLQHMVRVPMLYHQIMLSYQTFKVEHRELLETSREPDQS